MLETQQALNSDFNRPQSQAQSIKNLKEIQPRVNEFVWDFDKKWKFLIQQANMTITNNQHRDSCIALLLPHLRLPLSQQKIGTKEAAVDITLRIEASPV